MPGLIEAFCQTLLVAAINREIKPKIRERGLSAAAMVENLLVLRAAGGQRPEDVDVNRDMHGTFCPAPRRWPVPSLKPRYPYPERLALARISGDAGRPSLNVTRTTSQPAGRKRFHEPFGATNRLPLYSGAGDRPCKRPDRAARSAR